MTDEEIKQMIAKIKTRREYAYIDPTGKPSEYDGRIAFGQVGQLLEIVKPLSDKLAEQEKEIKLLREYHKASEDLDTDPNNAYHAYHALSLARAALSSYDDMRAKEQCK